jgi:hypothetical protein
MRDEPGLFHALSDTVSRATDLIQWKSGFSRPSSTRS